MSQNPNYVYVPELGLYIEFNLLLARYQPSVYTVIDAKGNIHQKPFFTITDGGSVTLPAVFGYNKQKFTGIDAIVKKLSLLYPEIKITKEKFLKSVKKAVENGKYQETSIKNMIKIYLYLSCYERGRVKPNSKDWFVFKGKAEISFPETEIQPIPLG